MEEIEDHKLSSESNNELPPDTRRQVKRRNFLSFATFFAAGGAAYGGWKWLYNSPPEVPGITAGAHKPLRRALNKTELVFRNFFSNNHLVKTYPVERAAKQVRLNESIGAKGKIDTNAWKLNVMGLDKKQQPITIEQIKALPKTEIVYSFKCVEGWDQIQHWGGLRFIDFIEHFGLAKETQLAYVGIETPDGGYYVGLDMPSALHPQTLLAYEMNGQPLTLPHGAPLRLIIPVKYGIKNLKRIGTISFSNIRPRDYWAELGYDYYSGL